MIILKITFKTVLFRYPPYYSISFYIYNKSTKLKQNSIGQLQPLA